MAQRGMVVCPHYLASEAGLRILQQGGNAVDAAIALNSTLSVVYPHMTGLGGDSFWLIYEAKTGRVHGLNGSGRSAQAATRELYQQQGFTTLPTRGPLAAITVPGTVDAWCSAHQRFGGLPLYQLLQPAIGYAANGYPISQSQARWTRTNYTLLSQYEFSRRTFLPGSQVPEVGTILANPDLAYTLKAIATGGRAAFYQGEIAQAMTTYLAEIGGILILEDFAMHHSDWVDPITTQYRGQTICQLPPNTQGLAVLQILNLLAGFDLQQIGHATPDYYHLMVEATKLAFADRDRWLSDPNFTQIPLQHLISHEYAEQQRSRLDLAQAQFYGSAVDYGDTTYSAIVDAAGNAVSMIQSLYFDYGCGVVAGETGVVLQNRGAFFSLDAAHINRLEPKKRTFHTLIPAMVLNGPGQPTVVLGTMGGEGQPQTQIALLTRVIDFGFDPQSAIDWPRWLYGRTWGETASDLLLEQRIPIDIRSELAQRGHSVRAVAAWSEKMGHAHMIMIDPETGMLRGGADPRSDGVAMGW
ncbi:MAG: gamma-glutamyltransferase [Cyanothece sp. SIO1E1]|nr:gamma-glutamyltransferase [Cyanothece sp. SIO1E1]